MAFVRICISLLVLGVSSAQPQQLPTRFSSIETDCATQTSTSEFEKNMGNKINKTGFSSSYRIAFFAGLGGTGHHMWANVTNECGRDGVCRDAPWRPHLWVHSKAGHDKGLFSSYGRYPLHRVYCKAKSQFAAADSIRNHDKFTLEVANTMSSKHTGMMSYPNYWMGFKGRNQPDSNLLANLAEEVNLDIRFVVLLRHPWSQVSSVRRRFSHGKSFRLFMQAFGQTHKALFSQLQTLDHKFFTCVSLEEITDYGSAVDKLLFGGATLMPTKFRSFASQLNHLVDKTHASTYTPPDDFQKRVLREHHYFEVFNQIQDLCKANTVYGTYKPIKATLD